MRGNIQDMQTSPRERARSDHLRKGVGWRATSALLGGGNIPRDERAEEEGFEDEHMFRAFAYLPGNLHTKKFASYVHSRAYTRAPCAAATCLPLSLSSLRTRMRRRAWMQQR